MSSSVLAPLLGLVLVASACGGKQKGGNTPADVNAGDSLLGQDNPTGELVGAGGATDAPADTPKPADEPKAEPPPPEETVAKTPPPKPPGQDLPPEERDRIVKSHLTIGREAERKGDADAMIREAMAVLDVDETNVEAMVLLATGYFLKGSLDKAEAITDEALKQAAARKNAKLYMLRGLIFSKTERVDQALEAYTLATEIDPGYAAAWTNRGIILLDRRVFSELNPGKKDGAVACFEAAMGLIGRNRSAPAHTHLGSAYRGQANDDKSRRDDLLKKAEAEFKTAMTVDPSYAPAYHNLGLLYFDADPFPGVDKLARLDLALRYLREYKRIMGPSLKAGDKVEEYMATAQRSYELEEKKRKREEEKRKKQEEKERKKKEKAAGDGGGGEE
jgi:tetratricopeptide (TPR) repeat protein